MGLFGNSKSAANNKAEGATNNQPKKIKGLARSVQDILDFSGITADGIIISNNGNFYSRLYKLVDSNFVTEPPEKQYDSLMNYQKFINRFPDNVDVNIIVINKRNTMENLAKDYHIQEQSDEFDRLRKAYNDIIDAKITEGRNDITKDKYIMLTAKEQSLDEAISTFNNLDLSINDAIKAVNKVGVTIVDGIERIKLIGEILNGIREIPFEKEYARYISRTEDEDGNVTEKLNKKALDKAGVSIKDLIAPQTISRTKTMLMLNENRYVKSFCYANLPTSLDTVFLTKSTNLPYEMVTVIQLNCVPRKKALSLVKNKLTSVKADVIKASQQAYKNGYSPDLINEDLQRAQDEAKKLRNDVVNEGKKIFYATMVVSIFGESEDEINRITEQFKAVCSDYTVTPSYLIGQQVQGLNTACCFSRSKVVIDRMLTSDDCCALYPFNIQEMQDKRGHFYGINAISKNMIMYDRKRSKLANGLVFGQSGSGKSFITKGEIIPNLLDGNDDMIILDPENEYRIISESYKGITIDLELNSEYCINPCDMAMEWADSKASPLAEKCDYMVSLVESILGKGRECNSFEVNSIHKATAKMYEPYMEEMERRRKDGETNDFDPTICPTLVDFFNCLTDQRTPEAIKLANSIEPYCVGQYDVFARRTNVPTGARLTVYNLLSLPEKMKEMAMRVCLSNIWTRIVRNRFINEKNGTNKAIWVYLDEFHLFFTNERSASTIMSYFKRVRKYNAIMTGITQDVADLLRTAQGTAMFNNTGFFIFLNQAPIGRQQLQNLYNISDSLIEYIKDKPAGQGLIYNNSILVPFDYRLPVENELYRQMSTNPNDKKRKRPVENAETA